MATLTFTIDDTIVDRVLDAMCWRFRYEGEDVRADKAEFCRQHIRNYLKQITKEYESHEAANAAALAAGEAADNEIEIT